MLQVSTRKADIPPPPILEKGTSSKSNTVSVKEDLLPRTPQDEENAN